MNLELIKLYYNTYWPQENAEVNSFNFSGSLLIIHIIIDEICYHKYTNIQHFEKWYHIKLRKDKINKIKSKML